ncbi:MAG: replication factor C small subunit [Candidatus Pacearchaeota archaeon]
MNKEKTEVDSTIWTEKYRPKTFSDIVGHEDIVKRAKAFVEAKNMPHLLFAGPAGCGKTTLALIIAKQLFKEKWRENFLELNASDERGIDVIRQKVKSFARTKSIGEIPFKIILLDESDALTKDAQHALRRIMEMFTGTCRFILSCNVSSKIIDPIQSRCAIFRFKPLEKKDVIKIIEKIAKQENLKIDNEAINVLYNKSKGDLRRVINLIQASSSITKNITKEILYEVISEVQSDEIKQILEMALKGNFIDAREKLLEIMLKKGLGGLDVIKAISQELWNLNIKDEDKIKLVEKCGEIEFRLVEGSDEFIQLEALLASFVSLKK